MTTDQGAIYVTNNRAYTWSAAVLETVDATLNRTVSSGEGGHRGCCCNLQQLEVQLAFWGWGAGMDVVAGQGGWVCLGHCC
jgi:photosystem II stability/assembly factor-like uncharacterized protein